MKKFLYATALLLSLFFSSCASIVTGSSTSVFINSDPEDAKLSIVNKKGEVVYTGKTPATVKLDNSSKYMSGERYAITFSRSDYQEQTVYLTAKIDGWYWGNILFGGLIGFLVIDPLTGAMYKLDKETVAVTLEKKGDTALNIVDINTLSKDQKDRLIKLN